MTSSISRYGAACKYYLKQTLGLVILLAFVNACDSRSDMTPEEHIEAARKLLAENNYREGIIELKSALQKDANMARARWLLAQTYLKTNNGEAAYKELQQAQSLGYQNPDLEAAFLRALLLQGKHQEILDKTHEIAASDDAPADILSLRGDAYLGLNNAEGAKTSFNRALVSEPGAIEPQLGLARLAMGTGKLDEAAGIIQKLSEQAPDNDDVLTVQGQLAFLRNELPKAGEYFSKATEINPYNLTARIGHIRSLLARDKNDEARKVIAAIEELYPRHPITRFYRGYIALDENDPETAKDLLREVLKVAPNHAESQLLMSQILYREGNLDQAREHLVPFLSSFPRHVPALKLMAVIQVGLNRKQEAIETLENARQYARNDAQLLAVLGSIYSDTGQQEKGMELLQQAAEIDPEAANIRAQLALKHLVTGNRESAVSELETAIELDPELIRADILLIMTHLQSKEFDAALQAAEKFEKKHPDNPVSYNMLGSAYFGKGDLDSAINQFNKALELNPQFTPALANLAAIDRKQGNTDAAEKRYRKILEIDKNNLQALINLAKLEADRGNAQQMYQMLEQAREANPSSLEPRILLGRFFSRSGNGQQLMAVAREAAEISPENPEVLLLLGRAQRVNGNTDEALRTLDKLAQKAPESADALYELAITQIQADKIELAKQNLDKILSLQPEHEKALISSAEIAAQLNDFAGAHEYIAKIREINPDSITPDILEGDLLLLEEKPSEAARSYEKAMDQQENAHLIFKLARAYRQAGNPDKAEKLLLDWLSEHPDHINIKLILASNYQNDNRDQDAIRIYKEILEQQPDNIIALNNLAWLYLDKDIARAHELANKAFEMAPKRPEILDTLGWILVKQNKIEQGLKHLNAALAIAPDYPDINYHVAAALAATGEKGKARDKLAALLEKHDDFSEKKEAERLYQSLK